MTAKSQVADVDRSLYDFTKSEEGYERVDRGAYARHRARDIPEEKRARLDA